jgi:hypothetical protein
MSQHHELTAENRAAAGPSQVMLHDAVRAASYRELPVPHAASLRERRPLTQNPQRTLLEGGVSGASASLSRQAHEAGFRPPNSRRNTSNSAAEPPPHSRRLRFGPRLEPEIGIARPLRYSIVGGLRLSQYDPIYISTGSLALSAGWGAAFGVDHPWTPRPPSPPGGRTPCRKGRIDP